MAKSKEYQELQHKLYPTFFSLCEEIGPGAVWERYFDEEMNVRDDAPQALREEIARMREEKAAEDRLYHSDGEIVR